MIISLVVLANSLENAETQDSQAVFATQTLSLRAVMAPRHSAQPKITAQERLVAVDQLERERQVAGRIRDQKALSMIVHLESTGLNFYALGNVFPVGTPYLEFSTDPLLSHMHPLVLRCEFVKTSEYWRMRAYSGNILVGHIDFEKCERFYKSGSTYVNQYLRGYGIGERLWTELIKQAIRENKNRIMMRIHYGNNDSFDFFAKIARHLKLDITFDAGDDDRDIYVKTEILLSRNLEDLPGQRTGFCNRCRNPALIAG